MLNVLEYCVEVPARLCWQRVVVLGCYMFGRLHMLRLPPSHLLVLSRCAARKEVLLLRAEGWSHNLAQVALAARVWHRERISICASLVDSGHLPVHCCLSSPAKGGP